MAGGRVTFSCSADGVPTPSISWFKDSTFISADSGKKFELTETTITTTGIRENINETFTSVLSVVGVAESDAGLYECSASNRRGSNAVIQPPFNLTVTPAPLPDFCDPNPCQNEGTCENGPLTYICKCTDGFKGTNCDEGIDLGTLRLVCLFICQWWCSEKHYIIVLHTDWSIALSHDQLRS